MLLCEFEHSLACHNIKLPSFLSVQRTSEITCLLISLGVAVVKHIKPHDQVIFLRIILLWCLPVVNKNTVIVKNATIFA